MYILETMLITKGLYTIRGIYMPMKERLSMTIKKDLLIKLDKERGRINRSVYVQDILEKYLK